jgi:hypothetical protein
MKHPPPKVLSLMKVAAEQRAFGVGWSHIATEVNRDERSCRRWAEQYPEVWASLFREAEEKRHAEVAGEALNVLYRTMRKSKDERLAQNTAKFLFGTRRSAVVRLPRVPPGVNPFPSLEPLLEDYPDEQLRSLFDDYLADRAARRAAGAVPGSADPAGPPVAG